MKKFFNFSILLTALTFASCGKENIAAPVNNTPYNINVEYRISDVSGHVNIQYNQPDANGQIVTQSMSVDRTNYSTAFTWKSGQELSVIASNSTPSAKEINVEIYVNGALFKTGLANSPNAIATASGRF